MPDVTADDLRAARARQRLTVRALAELAGVSTTTIVNGEAGRNISGDSARKLAAALGITQTDDPSERPAPNGDPSPTVAGASRIVLDLPEGVLAGLAPEDVAELKSLALAAFLRGRREMRQ